MNRIRLRLRSSERDADQRGFTLIEMLISITILALLSGALAAAFVTSMTAHSNNSQTVHASIDAQLIAAFLIRDGQSAGGTNPITGLIDSSLGVSVNWVAENAGTDPDSAACTEANPDQLLIRFAWRDNVDADLSNSHVHLAKYYYVPPTGTTDGQIVRVTCLDSVRESELTLGTDIGTPAPTATCVASTDCPGVPNLVQLHVHEVANRLTPGSPYSYTLTANVRASNDVPSALGTGNAASVPVLALGDGNCQNGASYDQGGSSTGRIFGGVAVGGNACNVSNFFGNAYSYTAAGDPQRTTILDPYQFLPLPTGAGTCPADGSGTNPPPDGGGVYQSGVYPQALPSNAALGPGTFVLCKDVPTGLHGTGVMLYLERGQLNWNGNSTTNLIAANTGPYAGIAIWQPKANPSPINILGGAALNLCTTLASSCPPATLPSPGLGSGIYAPKALVSLTGTANISIGWIVAQAVLITGDHTVTIGIPPATLPSIDPAPASLPTGVVGHAYPPTQITATGGAGGNTWSDVDPNTHLHTLPNGLTINALSGVISGTPTAPCSNCTVVITVTDNLGDVSRKAYPLTVDALPTITSIAPNALGQGAASVPVTINGTGFNAGATVTFSGTAVTAANIVVVSANKITAAVTVAPNAATGARDLTITNTDSGTVTKVGALTVDAAPTVTTIAPAALGQGAMAISVTINGTGFVAGANVAFTGTGVTLTNVMVVNANKITANVTVAAGAATGPRDVTVTNPDFGIGTGTGVFTVNAGPTIASINPATHTRNAVGVPVTITGTGLENGATVSFTGPTNPPTASPTTWVSAAQINFTITIPNKKANTYDVVVTNPDGGTFTLTGGFSYT